MRRLLASAAIATLLPTAGLAQGWATFFSVLTPERLIQSMLQSGVLALRTQIDMQYGAMSVDLLTNSVSISDVSVWPLPEWDEEGDCVVTVDRLSLRSAALDDIDNIRVKATVTGLDTALSCLPPEARQGLAPLGLTRLEMPHLTVDMNYGVPASDLDLRARGVIDRVAAVEFSTRFSYFWFDARDDPDEPTPVMFLSNATLEVENLGAWDMLQGLLPPPFTDPASAAGAASAMLGQAMVEMNKDAAPFDATEEEVAPNPEQQAFADSAGAVWAAFLEDPRTLVIESRIDGDVYLDIEAIEEGPAALFAALKPALSLAPARVSEAVDVALLARARSGAAVLTADDRRRVGLAFVTGAGAPRNVGVGLELLQPLASDGDAEAALALAEAMETRDAAEAYRWALEAGAAGESRAVAVLDRLERGMDFATVLEVQEAVSGTIVPDEATLASVSGLRNAATARLDGQGAARSYGAALLWATLGAAAGDPGAQDILERIDERVRLAGPEARAAWDGVEASYAEAATALWIDQDLPARYQR